MAETELKGLTERTLRPSRFEQSRQCDTVDDHSAWSCGFRAPRIRPTSRAWHVDVVKVQEAGLLHDVERSVHVSLEHSLTTCQRYQHLKMRLFGLQ